MADTAPISGSALSAESSARAEAAGVAYGVLAFTSWGAFPAFWKQLAGVPSLVIVAHRVAWSSLFVLGVLALSRRLPELARAARDRSTRRALAASTALISINWLLFVWAVNSGRVLEASLGYYMNPLVNVALGRVVLGEKLGRPEKLAVLLAAAGVAYLALGVGRVPWVSLSLAVSFGLYGLVRKMARLKALTGLAAETTLATPLALAYLVVVASQGGAVWGASPRELGFIVASGVATALPLWWFALAARRLRYATIGILQYIAPTGQLLLAVLVYGESFTVRHATAFGLIWSGVAVYSWAALRAPRR